MPIGATPSVVYTLTGACHGPDAENVAAPLTLTVPFGANNECSDPKSRPAPGLLIRSTLLLKFMLETSFGRVY